MVKKREREGRIDYSTSLRDWIEVITPLLKIKIMASPEF